MIWIWFSNLFKPFRCFIIVFLICNKMRQVQNLMVDDQTKLINHYSYFILNKIHICNFWLHYLYYLCYSFEFPDGSNIQDHQSNLTFGCCYHIFHSLICISYLYNQSMLVTEFLKIPWIWCHWSISIFWFEMLISVQRCITYFIFSFIPMSSFYLLIFCFFVRFIHWM